MSLKGKAAVITGASNGIGTATARTLVAAGAKVVVAGRREDRLAALVAELPPKRAVAAPSDLLDPETPAQLMEACLDAFGTCDIVVNNAGTMHVGTIEDMDMNAAARMIRVNVEAVTQLSYAALRHFKAQGSGHLVNISSILGTKVRPTTGIYAGTKYAVEALSEALRMELAGTNIKLSVIEPGLVDTELQDHFATHPKDALGIQRLLDPEDIARCIRFVLEQPDHVRIPVMMVLPSEQAM